MRQIRSLLIAALVALLATFLAACGDDSDSGSAADSSSDSASADDDASSEPAAATGEAACAGETTDLLAEICDKGTITVSTDPAYPPQSSLNEKTGKYEGFDIDVATEIAKRLGVKIAWETPAWDVITAGSWNGRWDMSVGSMTPTNDRQKVLDFSQPYYYTPAVVVVHKRQHDVNDLSTDLDGKKIGVCCGCTYEQFLNKTLAIKGFTSTS